MAAHPTPIDISTMPDLVRLVEEVATTKKPRALQRDKKTVAVLMPVTPAPQGKTTYEASLAALGSWRDLDANELMTCVHRSRAEGSRSAIRL